MRCSGLLFPFAALCSVLVVLALGCGGPERAIEQSLRDHVIFFSNFEKEIDALYSVGGEYAELDGARTRRHEEGGIKNGCLAFEEGAGALSYEANGNFPYAEGSWSGGVSFWVAYDPTSDPGADFPEPFHIGKREGYPWDDAVIFVDFTKPPRALRFGCYPNKTVELTDRMIDERQVRVEGITWKADEWHHIAITWSNFNSGRPDAEWALYLDGVLKGKRKGLQQDVTWDMANQVVRFNHYKFAGKIDEIAIFGKMLTPWEAKYLWSPKKALNQLLKKKP